MRALTTAIAIALIFLFAFSALAETEVKVNGQVRYRGEFSKKSFDPDAKFLEASYLRTRINVEAVKDDNMHAFVQLQDSRMIGGTTSSGDPASAGLNDGENVDLHQAYVQLDRIWINGLGSKVGRFELNLGNQRVFGAVGWHNVGRSWEGGISWIDQPSFRVDMFSLKRLELNDDNGNRDFNVWGAQLALKELGFEVFGFYENDANETFEWIDNDTARQVGTQIDALQRASVGIHGKRVSGQADVEINGVYQFGKMRPGDSQSETDIQAFLATAEIGYAFNPDKKGRIAAGIDFASGDSDPNDDKYKAYQNLYYTGHKFRGYMDYFLGSGSDGLMDLMARFRYSPYDKWLVNLDVHHFSTAQEMNAEGDKGLGLEFDLGVTTTSVKGVKMVYGASLFLPSEAYAGMADKEAGFWGYSMLIANF